MKEYEEICQYIGFDPPISIWVLGLRKIPSIAFIQFLELGKIPNSPPLYLYMGLGTLKNSTPEFPPGLWDLEKFLAIPPPPILKNMKHDFYFLARPRNVKISVTLRVASGLGGSHRNVPHHHKQNYLWHVFNRTPISGTP